MTDVAIFDFDKTITSFDTCSGFLKFVCAKRPLRKFFATIFFLPLVVIFSVAPYSMGVSRGVALFFWVTTFGINKHSFESLLNDFLDLSFSGPEPKVYQNALAKIEEHQALGHEIIVISGTPKWMVTKVLERVNVSGVRIMGSNVERFLGGYLFKEHCYADRKVKIISREFGEINGESWCYTDSRLDVPILAICDNKYLVNPSPRTLRKCKNVFEDQISILEWV